MTANGVHGNDDDDRSLNENAATAAQQLLAAVKVATPVRASASLSSGGIFDGFLLEIEEEEEKGLKTIKNYTIYMRDRLFIIYKINFNFVSNRCLQFKNTSFLTGVLIYFIV